MPLLEQRHPRVVSLPKELGMTSQIEIWVREEKRDRVGAESERVEIILHTISYPSSMVECPFDDFSDDRLKSMI